MTPLLQQVRAPCQVNIAHSYQCYHAAAIALALAERPGMHVINLFNDAETPHHLKRIRNAHGAAERAADAMMRLLEKAAANDL